MSDFYMEVWARSESVSVDVNLGNSCSLGITIGFWKLRKEGSIYLEYENGPDIYEKLFAKWYFNTDTTTQQFLAEYDTEALVEDLFKDCDMPHEEKRYIANVIIRACEKLENGEGDNG